MNVLVIDDDPVIRKIFSDVLEAENHKVFTAENGEIGLPYFLKESIDICFLDLWMPNIGGIDILKKIKEDFPKVEVVMISGQARINFAVKATKLGAYDFIEKPLSISNLMSTIKNIEKQKKSIGIVSKESNSENEMLVGSTPQMEYVKKLIGTSAKSEARILITGENGTGKEIVAREIHKKSLRANKQFVGVNCAAIPENLIESELFGYTKGSFTGAYTDKPGKFEAADGGTLFLDEVGDMSLSTQAKLLRVLQEMAITRVGSAESIPINVRIISATNKDLKEEIKNGNFREDLYYRLNVVPIYIPPLRERKEDISLFVEYFLGRFVHENETSEKEFSHEALEYLKSYPWPGNVRQLKNLTERLIIMSAGKEITEKDVEKHLDTDAIQILTGTLIENKYEKYKLNEAREEFEKDFIQKKLLENDFNFSKTAKILGVYPSNLHSKINKLGIDIEILKKMYYNK